MKLFSKIYLSKYMKWKYEWPLWMFLDFPENNNNALAPAVLMPRGVGNTIITPTLHIPSLAFLCYMYYIQRDWKTSSGNWPYPCQLLLSNHISKYLVLDKNISRLNAADLDTAHSAILQLQENWRLASNRNDITTKSLHIMTFDLGTPFG